MDRKQISSSSSSLYLSAGCSLLWILRNSPLLPSRPCVSLDQQNCVFIVPSTVWFYERQNHSHTRLVRRTAVVTCSSPPRNINFLFIRAHTRNRTKKGCTQNNTVPFFWQWIGNPLDWLGSRSCWECNLFLYSCPSKNKQTKIVLLTDIHVT